VIICFVDIGGIDDLTV